MAPERTSSVQAFYECKSITAPLCFLFCFVLFVCFCQAHHSVHYNNVCIHSLICTSLHNNLKKKKNFHNKSAYLRSIHPSVTDSHVSLTYIHWIQYTYSFKVEWVCACVCVCVCLPVCLTVCLSVWLDLIKKEGGVGVGGTHCTLKKFKHLQSHCCSAERKNRIQTEETSPVCTCLYVAVQKVRHVVEAW